jgi:hypothetical protein
MSSNQTTRLMVSAELVPFRQASGRADVGGIPSGTNPNMYVKQSNKGGNR